MSCTFEVPNANGVSSSSDRETTLAFGTSNIPTHFSLNRDSPSVPAYLGLPTLVDLHTFGHSFATRKTPQRGGRWRRYLKEATSHGVPSSIAVDARTGVTFYTQAPKPPDTSLDGSSSFDWTHPQPIIHRPTHTKPPLAAFGPVPDPKVISPPGSVWIVMVY